MKLSARYQAQSEEAVRVGYDIHRDGFAGFEGCIGHCRNDCRIYLDAGGPYTIRELREIADAVEQKLSTEL